MASNLLISVKRTDKQNSSEISKTGIQRNGQGQSPDYSSMMEEIAKIQHPVSFNFLKRFYGLV